MKKILKEEEYATNLTVGTFRDKSSAISFLQYLRQKYGFTENNSFINGNAVVVTIEKSQMDDSYYHEMIAALKAERTNNVNSQKIAENKIMKITEKQLKRAIFESVMRYLKEEGEDVSGALRQMGFTQISNPDPQAWCQKEGTYVVLVVDDGAQYYVRPLNGRDEEECLDEVEGLDIPLPAVRMTGSYVAQYFILTQEEKDRWNCEENVGEWVEDAFLSFFAYKEVDPNASDDEGMWMD